MGEWVRRTGSFSLACTAHSRAWALPARAPSALISSYAAWSAQRRRPSSSAGWDVSVLTSGSGGTWLVTAWVGTGAHYAGIP